MRRRLVAALAVATLTVAACQPTPPQPIPGYRATPDPTGCRPPETPFGGRWLIGFWTSGWYRYYAEGYTPTGWEWHAAGSVDSFQLNAVRPWWVQQLPTEQRVSPVTNYVPVDRCGSPV